MARESDVTGRFFQANSTLGLFWDKAQWLVSLSVCTPRPILKFVLQKEQIWHSGEMMHFGWFMFHFIYESNNAAINRIKKLLNDFFFLWPLYTFQGQREAGDYPTCIQAYRQSRIHPWKSCQLIAGPMWALIPCSRISGQCFEGVLAPHPYYQNTSC